VQLCATGLGRHDAYEQRGPAQRASSGLKEFYPSSGAEGRVRCFFFAFFSFVVNAANRASVTPKNVGAISVKVCENHAFTGFGIVAQAKAHVNVVPKAGERAVYPFKASRRVIAPGNLPWRSLPAPRQVLSIQTG